MSFKLTAEELVAELSEFITEGKVADDECDSVYTRRKAPFHPGVSSYVPLKVLIGSGASLPF